MGEESKTSKGFGSRYGRKIRARVQEVETKRTRKQSCDCGGRLKRVSAGVFICRKCGKKMTSGAYYKNG
jgi:large subunit ribosomal protein L37Ae